MRRNKIYVGQTNNFETRLKRHNNLLPTKVNSYTHINNGDWIVVHQEEFLTRKEALEREKQLKSQKGREFVWNRIRSKYLCP